MEIKGANDRTPLNRNRGRPANEKAEILYYD